MADDTSDDSGWAWTSDYGDPDEEAAFHTARVDVLAWHAQHLGLAIEPGDPAGG